MTELSRQGYGSTVHLPSSEFAQRSCWSSLNSGSRTRRGGDKIGWYAAVLNLFAWHAVRTVCNQNLQAPDEPFVRWRVETVRDRICMETKNTRQHRNTRFRTDGKGKGETETGEGGWMEKTKKKRQSREAGVAVWCAVWDERWEADVRDTDQPVAYLGRVGISWLWIADSAQECIRDLGKAHQMAGTTSSTHFPRLGPPRPLSATPASCCWPGRVEHARRGRPVCVAQSANPAGGLLISPWAADDDAGHYGARQSAD